jgi:signal peptide peptidase SppA
MTKLSRVAASVFNHPWYIVPRQLDTIAELVRFHLEGGRLSRDEIGERLAAAQMAAGPRRGPRTQGAVAVIPISGTIFPHANLMTEISGGATVDGIRAAFREAMADESIGSILFDVDSPGGYTDGIEELATEIRNARGRKPMSTIANYMMASAAYYLGAQADEIVASPSSEVGWIGTVMVLQEFSKMDEMDGVTTTILRDPPGKYGGNQYEPLSDQARAEFQAIIDERSAQFHSAVAKARGISAARVRSDYGQGGGMTASRAKAAGMVDRIESIDETIRRLASGKGPIPRGTSAQAAPVAAALTQEGGSKPADDPDASSSGEAGTPPDRSREAEAALALARARAR